MQLNTHWFPCKNSTKSCISVFIFSTTPRIPTICKERLGTLEDILTSSLLSLVFLNDETVTCDGTQSIFKH